jgi:hypothetical protein
VRSRSPAAACAPNARTVAAVAAALTIAVINVDARLFTLLPFAVH